MKEVVDEAWLLPRLSETVGEAALGRRSSSSGSWKEKGEERMMFAEPTPSRRCWHTSANYQLTFALDSIISFVTLYFSVYKTLLFHL